MADTCLRPPVERPAFTVGQLRAAIPPHCFERSLAKSAAYLAVDLVAVTLLAVAAIWGIPRFAAALPEPWGLAAQFVLWPLYWYWQGAVCTGIWVIAHECGHQAFSTSQAINDTVGFVLHSALLVPYFSWKYSHRRHHSNTGSVAKDEVFVPPRDEDEVSLLRFTAYRIGFLAVQCLLGWPLYLFFNASGREYSRYANHFDPSSPIFNARERAFVLLSDLGLAGMLAVLYAAAQAWGWAWLARVYVAPYLVVNFWLVTITFLQHTHPNLPHYEEDEWDWLRGALATVDRSYGLLDHVFHHIADTHVTHHLFSQMPHYHAQEATEALKLILGRYYNRDGRNIYKALWQETSLCHFVGKEEASGAGVLWFSTHGSDAVVSATAAAAAGFNADAAIKAGRKAD